MGNRVQSFGHEVGSVIVRWYIRKRKGLAHEIFSSEIVSYGNMPSSRIVDRHSGYTYIIPCTAEIDADGVIDILERHIKTTVGLSLSIVSDQDTLFMSGEF